MATKRVLGGQGDPVAAAIGVDEVLMGIEGNLIDVLDESGVLRDDGTRELLVEYLRRYLGTALALRRQTTVRTNVIELVRVCARQERGLEFLVAGVRQLEPMLPELSTLLQLCDEWYAAHAFLDGLWPELSARLRSCPPGEGKADLRQLVLIATESRVPELPEHCQTAWHVFTHLAGANSSGTGLPPCVVFLDCLADRIDDDELAGVLRRWTRHWAAELKLADLLDAAAWRGPVPTSDPSSAYLVLQFEPNAIDPDEIAVSSWRAWDPRGWRPQRERDRVVRRSALKGEVDRTIAEMEKVLGARDDADRIGAIQVEFVLPAELLHLDVEMWPKSPIPPGVIPIAVDHPVVIRSLERLRNPRLHHVWKRRWARAMAGENTGPYWSMPDGTDYFQRLPATLAGGERIVALVLSEAPADGGRTAIREFNAALQAGIPAILWHREDCSADSFRRAVSQIVSGPFIHLPQRVAALRREALGLGPAADGTHAGHRFAIVWDDPGRFPEPPKGIG